MVHKPFPKVDSLEEIPCPFDLPYENEVTCGKLVVPEDYDNPDGPKISLTVARVHSTGTTPISGSIIIPWSDGSVSALMNLRYIVERPIFVSLLANNDLIFYDRRGLNYATPFLDCHEFNESYYQVLGQTLNRSSKNDATKEIFLRCRDKLIEEGTNLGFYVIDQDIADLHALILSLGEEQVDLLGSGYGADQALWLVENYPEKVNRVVVASPSNFSTDSPTQAEYLQQALDFIFQRCAEDGKCNQAYPDLESDFYALVQSLNKDPVTVEITKIGSIETMPIIVNGDLFLSIVRNVVNSDSWSKLPKLILDVKEGRTYHLSPDLQNAILSVEFRSLGVIYTHFCQISLTRQKQKPTSEVHEPLLEWEQYNNDIAVCSEWYPFEPNLLSAPVITGDVPLLIISGENISSTPSKLNEQMVETITNGKYVVIKGIRWVNWTESCSMQLALDFLEDPYGELDDSCADEVQPVEFILPMK